MLKAAAPRPPRDRVDSASMIVRPDLLRMTLIARVEGLGSGEAVALLEASIEALRAALARALPGAALILRGFELAASATSKSRSDGDAWAPSVSGVIEAPLADALLFWERARIVAALSAIGQAAVARGRSMRPQVLAGFSAPTPQLRDPERLRAALLERWFERAREISELARARGLGAGLRLVACEAPGAVHQRPLSLEEVEVELEFTASLEGPGGASTAAGA